MTRLKQDPCAFTKESAPTLMSAAELASAVQDGRLDAREVVAAHRRRVQECNPVLNAVVEERPELIEQDLLALEIRLATGARLPLAGVPVVVKDVIWVEDRRVTQGSQLFKDFIAPRDAIAVERLRAAGAVIIGMANSSEFACKGLTTNKVYGLTRHPADPSLTPGGSSGGSAAAVAAHLAPLSLSTDAGGSCRRPAAHVGVVGFKPSFGAVPDGPGFPAVVPGIQSLAPMARTVRDARLMFEVMAGADPLDPHSLMLSLAEPVARRTLRIAYSPSLGLDVPVEPEVRDAVETAIRRLQSDGFQVERVDPAWPEAASEAALMPLQHVGLAHLYGAQWRKDPSVFDPDVGAQIERGLQYSGAELARARGVSQEIALELARFFTRHDLLISPTTPCVAWPSDRLGPSHIDGREVDTRAHAAFTPFFNHALASAISIPCGQGRDGLPIGLQIAGPRGADRRVLDFAQWLEFLLQHTVRAMA